MLEVQYVHVVRLQIGPFVARQSKHTTKNNSLRNMISGQYLKYIDHVCRCPNTTLTKKMLFAKSRRPYKRGPWINIAKLSNVSIEQAKSFTQHKSGFAALVDCVVASATPWQQAYRLEDFNCTVLVQLNRAIIAAVFFFSSCQKTE